MNNNIKGKKYEFILGEIDDELVEEYRATLLNYCNVANFDKSQIGHKVATGEMEINDELLFQSAICFAKEYLKEYLKKNI